MLLSKAALHATRSAIAKTPDNRYYLHAIALEPDGTLAATDGHLLLVTRQTWTPDEADFPTGSRQIPDYEGNPAARVLIPTTAIDKAIKAMPKRSPIPVLHYAQVSAHDNGDSPTTIAATDLDGAYVGTLDTGTDGDGARFPNYTAIVPPADRPALTLTLSAEMLDRLIKAARAAGAATPAIRFSIPTEPQYQTTRAGEEDESPREPTGEINSAIRVDIAGDNLTIEGAVMPCVL